VTAGEVAAADVPTARDPCVEFRTPDENATAHLVVRQRAVRLVVDGRLENALRERRVPAATRNDMNGLAER
jgi:hypothetical protein